MRVSENCESVKIVFAIQLIGQREKELIVVFFAKFVYAFYKRQVHCRLPPQALCNHGNPVGGVRSLH